MNATLQRRGIGSTYLVAIASPANMGQTRAAGLNHVGYRIQSNEAKERAFSRMALNSLGDPGICGPVTYRRVEILDPVEAGLDLGAGIQDVSPSK